MYTESDVRIHIKNAIAAARAKNPLVGSITNTVTVNLVANAQLAVGGSAAMVYLPDEGEQLAQASGAFYINMGTLFPVYEETLPRTIAVLANTKTPWVLDPVAIGIGSLRTQLLEGMRATPPTIVRGNASEVIALARLWNVLDEASASTNAMPSSDEVNKPSNTSNSSASDSNGPRGVDATDTVAAAEPAAVALARFTGGAVCVSGPTDLVTDGETVVYMEGGSALMEKITGAGCSLGGVCGVYAAVAQPFEAALAATAIYNVAGKIAAELVDGEQPASFQVEFLDALCYVSPDEVAACSLGVHKASGTNNA